MKKLHCAGCGQLIGHIVDGQPPSAYAFARVCPIDDGYVIGSCLACQSYSQIIAEHTTEEPIAEPISAPSPQLDTLDSRLKQYIYSARL